LNTHEPSTWSAQARAGPPGEQASACFAWLCIGLAWGTSTRRNAAVEFLDLSSEMRARAEAYGRHLLSVGRSEDGAGCLSFPEAFHTSYAPEEAKGPSPMKPVPPGFRLSTTETVIARLVADGRSNKQIAAELVVSRKTVEYHLSNIYRRLGVTSRVKLAQLVQVAV